MPALLPADPEVVLGITKTAASALVDLAGDNKGVAIAGGIVLLAGLGIFGLMKLSASRKKKYAAGIERGTPGTDMAERYADAMDGKKLQAPQYLGRHGQTRSA